MNSVGKNIDFCPKIHSACSYKKLQLFSSRSHTLVRLLNFVYFLRLIHSVSHVYKIDISSMDLNSCAYAVYREIGRRENSSMKFTVTNVAAN